MSAREERISETEEKGLRLAIKLSRIAGSGDEAKLEDQIIKALSETPIVAGFALGIFANLTWTTARMATKTDSQANALLSKVVRDALRARRKGR